MSPWPALAGGLALGFALVIGLPLSAVATDCLTERFAEQDRSAIATLRAGIEAACPCVQAASAHAYRRCARDVVKDAVQLGLLRRQCRTIVNRNSRRSTCGLAGARAPCLRKDLAAAGKLRCSIRTEERCRGTSQGSRWIFCPGYTHCIDAADTNGDGRIGAADGGHCAVFPSTDRVTVWERFEAVLDRPVTAANPFDPSQIVVSGEFQSPSGVLKVVDGFVSREYARELRAGIERLTAVNGLHWKIRFTPDEPGEWSWRYRVVTSTGTQIGPWRALSVESAPEGVHGFVRRSTSAPHYLSFDDGSSFFAVGENMAWYDARGTFAYDDWLARIAAEGCNYVRLWMPSWAFGLEWIERDEAGNRTASSLGDYTLRLDRAWQLDYVMELARHHGIFVMLSIQNHGPFSLAFNSEWADNPYNVANGGPLASPRDFFVDAEARALFKRRLRYIVARWGSAPNLMAWELWNEVDLVAPPPVEDVVAWHREMAAEIGKHDVYRHLISTSTSLDGFRLLSGGDTPYAPLWELDEIDFVQVHHYGIGETLPVDFSAALPELGTLLRRYGKPLLVAEAGIDFRGPAETIRADPDGSGFHDILWAGLFAQSFGSGMAWWWDNVRDPLDQYFHFGPLAAFVAGVDFAAGSFRTGAATARAPDGRSLRAFALRGREVTLVWVKNVSHQWYSPDEAPIRNGTLELSGLDNGVWTATWMDTLTGIQSVGGSLMPVAGEAVLRLPVFSRDLALRLDREP
ncbi:MAG: DUF5060 domain-containing protein [Myxococcota bacterium]